MLNVTDLCFLPEGKPYSEGTQLSMKRLQRKVNKGTNALFSHANLFSLGWGADGQKVYNKSYEYKVFIDTSMHHNFRLRVALTVCLRSLIVLCIIIIIGLSNRR